MSEFVYTKSWRKMTVENGGELLKIQKQKRG